MCSVGSRCIWTSGEAHQWTQERESVGTRGSRRGALSAGGSARTTVCAHWARARGGVGFRERVEAEAPRFFCRSWNPTRMATRIQGERATRSGEFIWFGWSCGTADTRKRGILEQRVHLTDLLCVVVVVLIIVATSTLVIMKPPVLSSSRCPIERANRGDR